MRGVIVLLCMLLPSAVVPETPGTRLDLLRSSAASGQFTQASEPRVFEFPRDHGPHPEYRHEWWYVTGHLAAATGERFGFEVTFFRYALSPYQQQPRSESSSAWRTNQIYAAHFAVTDLAHERFYFTERYAREALGLAGAQSVPSRVWLENWSMALNGDRGTLHASSEQYRIDLELQPLLQPVLNGEGGLSRKSRESASYYYSIPRIAVQGQLARAAGRALEVTGLAWLDREWGSGSLSPDQDGWDWFALQLEDGSALMFYCLRRRDHRCDAYSAGTWIGADGQSRPLSNDEVELDVLDRWISPRGGTYPAAWRLRVPVLEIELTMRPLLADQELGTKPRYWEGAVAVEGRRGAGKIGGRGYVELVGYAETRAGTDQS